MSKLVFDGHSHELRLISAAGETLESWSAYNNVDSHAKLTHLKNGAYNVVDRVYPYVHQGDSADGPYGTYGIIRFDYPGHQGIGVHSGREHHERRPGPQHWTMGCIRTTDAAMLFISEHMADDNLVNIEIRNNSGLSHKGAKAQNHARHSRHRHKGHPVGAHESHHHHRGRRPHHHGRGHGHGNGHGKGNAGG
jgi:hypothetical protein